LENMIFAVCVCVGGGIRVCACVCTYIIQLISTDSIVFSTRFWTVKLFGNIYARYDETSYNICYATGAESSRPFLRDKLISESLTASENFIYYNYANKIVKLSRFSHK